MFQEAAALVEEEQSPVETPAPAEIPAPVPTPAGGVSLSVSQGNERTLFHCRNSDSARYGLYLERYNVPYGPL